MSLRYLGKHEHPEMASFFYFNAVAYIASPTNTKTHTNYHFVVVELCILNIVIIIIIGIP